MFNSGRLDLLDIRSKLDSFNRQASHHVFQRVPKFYVYLDLNQSPIHCDQFLKAIEKHPVFITKSFGMCQREMMGMGRYGAEPRNMIMHVFDVEFVGDRRIAAVMRHGFFRNVDGDTSIIRRVFGFIQTTRTFTDDGIMIDWPQ